MSSSIMILWLYMHNWFPANITAAQYCFKMFVVEHAPRSLYSTIAQQTVHRQSARTPPFHLCMDPLLVASTRLSKRM